MKQKAKPISANKPKGLGWQRTPITGFVLPRLNEPQSNTHPFGFTDPRRRDDEGWEDRKR